MRDNASESLNSAKFRPMQRYFDAKGRVYQYLSSKFPTHCNREFFLQNRESFQFEQEKRAEKSV